MSIASIKGQTYYWDARYETFADAKINPYNSRVIGRIQEGFRSLRLPSIKVSLNATLTKTFSHEVKTWTQTIKDIQAVHHLRQKLSYNGYPFSRLIENQVGDGILNAVVAGLAVVAASADPLLAGILVWGTRTVEYGIAVVWNQHMSSQRRLARLAAEGSEIENKLLCKWKAARELVSSCKYDMIAGVATVTGVVLAVVGGPISAVIGLGAVIAVCQTMSRFKEMSWGALRYIVNPDDKLQKEVVNLQEPMGAYEMALNIGAMTIAYFIAFAAITAFYLFVPEVALPVSIVLGVIGMSMMLRAKYQFKEEERQAKEALESEKQWQQTYSQLEEKFQRYQKRKQPEGSEVRISELQEAHKIMSQDSSTDRLKAATEELGQLITDLEKRSSHILERFLSKGHHYNIVSLENWKIEDLAQIYRASEESEKVSRKRLSQWLDLQDVLYTQLSRASTHPTP